MTDRKPDPEEVIASIDEIIALQAQKIDLLEQHGKGLAQLFSPGSGGPDSRPRLRFPEFQGTSGGMAEERKVAETLSSAAKILVLERQKLELYKKHRTGLEQLFRQEPQDDGLDDGARPGFR